ncbi:hypothetical protein OH76DRAFT_1414477 [Lentinus brumalis]|uniref:Uncharacterized protein n=1 Tax=Lentinus brumalis TaxID=2498619 RepID=A0A371DTZ6_9APHY|nr:hypothetical protein OH76DRAFT_1414477 [Polyporus brumalis]
MLLSNPNRKSFALSLSLPLSRASSSTRSKEHHKPQPSPMRDGFPSPHSPLVSASLHPKPEQPVLAISLADGLDPSEKMKLLRKTRKLSRILGEVPIPVSMEEADDLRLAGLLEEPSTSASSSSQSSPAGPPPGIERKGSLSNLHRSATVGHLNKSARQSKVQRTRSLASLRPSLAILPAALTTRTSPASPAACPYSHTLAPLPASPVSSVRVSGDSGKETIGPSRRDSLISVESRQRRDSTASSILFPERTPEQVNRARAAKLARQLGENIPPEMLLRAPTPLARSALASPSTTSFAEASWDSIQGPSANHDRSHPRRRLSLDIRTFVRGDSKDAPFQVEKHRILHRKSKSSLSVKKRRPNTAGAAVETVRRATPMAQDSDIETDPDEDLARPLTEKQRALNVRRARKMNQMFGNDPPPALYQITNIRPGAADDSVSVALTVAHRRRHSCATFVSVASNFSAPEVDGDRRRKSEDGTTGENLSPLIFAGVPSRPPSGEYATYAGASVEGDDESVLLPYLNSKNGSHTDLRPASPLGLPVSSPSQQSVANASVVSITPSNAPSQQSSAPLQYPARASFRASPPPFLNMFHWGSSSASPPPLSPLEASSPLSGPKSASETSPSDPLFRMRRMRAAKLSRFFGVGLQDITGMLVTEDPSPSVPVAPASKALPPIPVADPVPPVPPVPSLYSTYRSESAETIPPTPSSSTSARQFSSGMPPPEEPRSRKSSGRSSGQRSQSGTSGGRRGQAPPQPPTPTKSTFSSAQPPTPTKSTTSSSDRHERAPPTPTKSMPSRERLSTSGNDRTDRNRSNSEPDVLSQQAYGRAFSTTVEVAAETRSKYFFRESRRPAQTKELEMHAAIKQLRKIK